MKQVFTQVDELQRVRNVTCTVHNSCTVKVDGKCVFKSSGKKKKRKNKNKRP